MCVVSQNGPELLPRVGMLQLLTQVIATSTPRIQVYPSTVQGLQTTECQLVIEPETSTSKVRD